MIAKRNLLGRAVVVFRFHCHALRLFLLLAAYAVLHDPYRLSHWGLVIVVGLAWLSAF